MITFSRWAHNNFSSWDLMINSPYHLPHISYNSSPEELDFKSNNNSSMVSFFFVITPLFKNVMIIKYSFLVTTKGEKIDIFTNHFWFIIIWIISSPEINNSDFISIPVNKHKELVVKTKVLCPWWLFRNKSKMEHLYKYC